MQNKTDCQEGENKLMIQSESNPQGSIKNIKHQQPRPNPDIHIVHSKCFSVLI